MGNFLLLAIPPRNANYSAASYFELQVSRNWRLQRRNREQLRKLNLAETEELLSQVEPTSTAMSSSAEAHDVSNGAGSTSNNPAPEAVNDENSSSSISSLYEGGVPFDARGNRGPKDVSGLVVSQQLLPTGAESAQSSQSSQQSSIAFHTENQQGRMSFRNEPNGGQGAAKPKAMLREEMLSMGDGYRSVGKSGSYYRSIPILQKEPRSTLDNDPITYHRGASSNNDRFLEGMSCDLVVGDECRFCCEGLFNWRGKILSIDDSDPKNVLYFGDFSDLPHWLPVWNTKPYPRSKVSKYFKEADTSDLDRCLVRGHPLTHILSNRNRMKKGATVLLCDGTTATVYYNDPICWRIGVKFDMSSRIIHRLTYLKVLCLNPTPNYLAEYSSPQLAIEMSESSVRKRGLQSPDNVTNPTKFLKPSSSAPKSTPRSTTAQRPFLSGPWMKRAWEQCKENTKATLQQLRHGEIDDQSMNDEGVRPMNATHTSNISFGTDKLPTKEKKRVLVAKGRRDEQQNEGESGTGRENGAAAAAADWVSKLADLRQLAHDTITKPIIDAMVKACAQEPSLMAQTPPVGDVVQKSVPSAPHKFSARLFQLGQEESSNVKMRPTASSLVSATPTTYSSSANGFGGTDVTIVVDSGTEDSAVGGGVEHVKQKADGGAEDVAVSGRTENGAVGGGAEHVKQKADGGAEDVAVSGRTEDGAVGGGAEHVKEKADGGAEDVAVSGRRCRGRERTEDGAVGGGAEHVKEKADGGAEDVAVSGRRCRGRERTEDGAVGSGAEHVKEKADGGAEDVAMHAAAGDTKGNGSKHLDTGRLRSDGNEVIVVSSECSVVIETDRKRMVNEWDDTAPKSGDEVEEGATENTNTSLLKLNISNSIPIGGQEDGAQPKGPTMFDKDMIEGGQTMDNGSSHNSSSAESQGSSGGTKSYTEEDAKQLDYTKRLPLPKEMVSAVRSYLSKPKPAAMTSTLRDGSAQVLTKLRGGVIVGPAAWPSSPVHGDDGDTNDAFREVDESFMEHSFDDEHNDQQYCPFEVVFDNHAKGRRSLNATVAEKVYDNNPLMRYDCDVSGVCCLRLTVGSLVWVDPAFADDNLDSFVTGAKDASEGETTLLKKLSAFLSQMMSDFMKPFPPPMDFTCTLSGGKATKRKRVKDLPLDHRPPFQQMTSVALKQFSFEGVPVADVHATIAEVMRNLQKKNSNANVFARQSFLGIEPKTSAAEVDF